MGLFCVNLHFRSTDEKALSAALENRRIDRFRIGPAKNGWTSLFEERASQQDDERIRELAGGLSSDLRTAAIAFLVHDSDVACYWLYENGRLLDEYNSCPDYFDADSDDESPKSVGGRPDVLVRFCRPGVQQDQLAAILSEEATFAEDVIGRLAAVLGIDRARALANYNSADDEGSDDGDGGPAPSPLRTGLMSRLAGMLGLGGAPVAANPQVQALVNAAAQDDVNEIDRLLADGADVNAEAPFTFAGGHPISGLAQLVPGNEFKVAMTPLLAAVAQKRLEATKRLLAAGADPDHVHPVFGAPVHAAAGAGAVEILERLIDHGADVNTKNARGQTPLQVIAAGRASKDRLAQAQAMIKLMRAQLPGLSDQLLNLELPVDGWNACVILLRKHGAE